MSFPQRHTVSVTTDASGDATSYTPVVTGRVHTIKYTKTDFAAGVDFTITTEDTAQGLWTQSDVNASATRCPMQPTHDAIGAASLYAAAGESVETGIFAVNERVKIVVAQGGDTKTGTFDVIVI